MFFDPPQATATLFDFFLRPRGRARWLSAALIGVLMVGMTTAVYATGGTRTPWLHILYVPVLLAAFAFSPWGGVVAGVAAGLLVGPFMPLDTMSGETQATVGWMYRSGFFIAVGGLAGMARTRLTAEQQRSTELINDLVVMHGRVLTTFAHAVEIRDKQTAGHCDRVGHNAQMMAEALGFTDEQIKVTAWSGLMHDLGKIGVPESILLKPGPLTAEEFRVVQRHSALGADMLLSVSEQFADLAVGVRAHHERFDGTGYPDRLAGEGIPLIGRLLGVVDVFEALTSDRPYRKPLPTDVAISYLHDQAGSHFDPELVSVFEDLYRRGRIWVADSSVPSSWQPRPPLAVSGHLVA